VSNGKVKFVIEDVSGPVPALKQGGDSYSDTGSVHTTGAAGSEAATQTVERR